MEAVYRILSECMKLAQKAYKTRTTTLEMLSTWNCSKY